MDVHHPDWSESRGPVPSRHKTLQALLESLPPGAGLLLDERGTVLACGPTLPDFLSLPDELINSHVAQLSPLVLGQSLSELWRECHRTGEPALAEIVFCLDPAHQADPISVSLRVARHPGSENAYVVTIRDSSRDKGRIQALLDHIGGLERRMRDWEAAMQAAGHDTLSCLGALKGFLELTLRQQGLPAPAADNLRLAAEIAARVSAIAERVRGSAKPSPAGVPLVLEAMGHQLFGALQAAHHEVPFTWSVNARDLRRDFPAEVLWEVLWNLLSNSVKYRTPDRPLHIELSAGLELHETWVEVRDTGRGIPPGEEEAIFSRGQRGSNVADTPGSGTGLFSARQLLEENGAKICAVPCAEGSIIRVTFPGWTIGNPLQPPVRAGTS